MHSMYLSSLEFIALVLVQKTLCTMESLVLIPLYLDRILSFCPSFCLSKFNVHRLFVSL